MALTPDKIENWNGLKVNIYDLTKHCCIDMPSRNRTGMLGVTIHNTEAISVIGTTPAEQYTRATKNGNMGDVRVHFYVDDYCAWQNLPLELSSWHAADGGGNGNMKTISIEVIGNSAKAEANAAILAAYLLNKYKIGINGLFTHSHWLNVVDGRSGSVDYLNTYRRNGKNCPIYILPHWDKFKADVQSKLTAAATGATTTAQNLYRVRKTWEDAKSQIGAYTVLDNAIKNCKDGYKVFDGNGKEVYPSKPAVEIKNGIDIAYRVYSNNKWNNEIVNCQDKDSMGYAGIERYGITALAAKVSQGKLSYRVHLKNGGWLCWIDSYDLNDWISGYAGLTTQLIDAIEAKLEGVEGYEVMYRVSEAGSIDYYPWVLGTEDYAGVFGKVIDKVQMKVVKI